MNPTLTPYQTAVQNGPATGAGSASNYAATANGVSTTTVPTTGAPTPITVDTLGTGAKPVTVPPAAPTTTTTPTVAAPTGTTTDTNGQATVTPPSTTPAPAPQTTSDWIKEQFKTLGGTLATKAAVNTQLQTDQQLTQKTENAAKDYNAYNAAKVALQQKIDSMYKNPTGTTVEANNEAIAIATREGNANVANLAVAAQASQGLLSAAQQTIKDKLDAQFQPVQDQIDFLTKFTSVNNNDLTEKEKFQLTEQANQKKADLTNLTKTADDLHQALLQNKAPQSAYSALDKITNDYVAGKLTATDAQSKMYQAVGNYGVDMTKQLQQMKLRQDISNGDPVNGEDKAVALSGDVQDVLTGRNTIGNIRLQMGRTKEATAYLKDMRSEIRKVDPNFDFVASDAGSKFVSSTYYQKALGSINAVLPNIDTITKLSNDVSRIGVKGVDALLQKGQIQLGDKKVANFHEAQKLIADEIGVALGAGSVSDMKLQLGFDVTDPSVTPEVFASNMQLVKSFLENRVKGLNEQRYKSSTVGGGTTGGNTSVLTGPDGKQYNVPNDQVDAFIKAGGKK